MDPKLAEAVWNKKRETLRLVTREELKEEVERDRDGTKWNYLQLANDAEKK